MRYLIAILLAGSASPAFAQHQGHSAHGRETTSPATQEQSACEAEAERHRAMGHAVPEGACAPSEQQSDDHSGTDRSQMDHSTMDHSSMDHSSMSHEPGSDGQATGEQVDHSTMGHDDMSMEVPSGPPPASAGSGPANAADAYWGAEAMDEARELLRHEQGGQQYFWFQGDRVEYRAREGSDGYLFDLQGYYGGDLDKFWFKSEGEGSFGEDIEGAEMQALYSRAIAPFFDLQAGIRQDFAPMDRTYAVVGIQGLAPYLFEIDAAAFLSDQGDLTARVEAELDQRITQRLVIQPRVEASFSAQDVPKLGIGAGLDSIEAGVRLRYHFAREFAPYIGIDQEWRVGQSADYARAEGEDPSVTNYVVGVRFWF
ncbi:copper resistance protein B [Altererythrobacter sp. FM1]|uniref:copper resistance protein B n=1 Tax=Tsuneonella flava TaxID=2055955 RepID=UPI000C80F5B3|nr:copper resistance protein B [Tsuneonella flava]ROT94026.1 copper resistance protein B [Altererythrobacter sp. FM1]